MAVVLSCLLLAGCWDALPLEQRDIVLGVGVDLVTDAGVGEPPFEFTFVTPLFGGEKAYPSQVRTVRAHSLGQAVATIHHAATRTLFFGKQAFVLFGRKAAQTGVAQHLNELFAFPELRVNSYVLVAADTAKEVLLTVPPANQRVAEQILQMLRRADRLRDAPPITIADFSSRLLEAGFDPITGLITPIGSLDPRPPETKQDGGGSDASRGGADGQATGGGAATREDMQINATALWQGDRTVGEINLQETQCLTIVNESASGLLLTLLLPPDERLAQEPGLLQLRILSSDAKWQVALIDGLPQFQLEQGIYLTVSNYSGTVDISEAENSELMISLIEQAMAGNIQAALQKVSAVGSDPLALGQQIRREFPEYWRPEEWPNLLPKAHFAVQVKVRIRNFGTEIIGLHPE